MNLEQAIKMYEIIAPDIAKIGDSMITAMGDKYVIGLFNLTLEQKTKLIEYLNKYELKYDVFEFFAIEGKERVDDKWVGIKGNTPYFNITING